jgi:hypothetical protein
MYGLMHDDYRDSTSLTVYNRQKTGNFILPNAVSNITGPAPSVDPGYYISRMYKIEFVLLEGERLVQVVDLQICLVIRYCRDYS